MTTGCWTAAKDTRAVEFETKMPATQPPCGRLGPASISRTDNKHLALTYSCSEQFLRLPFQCSVFSHSRAQAMSQAFKTLVVVYNTCKRFCTSAAIVVHRQGNPCTMAAAMPIIYKMPTSDLSHTSHLSPLLYSLISFSVARGLHDLCYSHPNIHDYDARHFALAEPLCNCHRSPYLQSHF